MEEEFCVMTCPKRPKDHGSDLTSPVTYLTDRKTNGQPHADAGGAEEGSQVPESLKRHQSPSTE